MRDFAVPAIVPASADGVLIDPVAANATDSPAAVAFSVRRDGVWTDISAKHFADDVLALAKGLMDAGIGTGDRVGLLSATRYEWTLIDYAIWTAGAVTVPIYETSSADQVRWILTDSAPAAVFVEGERHRTLLESVRGPGDDQPVWCIDAGDLDGLRSAGESVSDAEVAARRQSIDGSSLATVIYTSGTTGRPKGCELTHSALLFAVSNAIPVLLAQFNSDASTLLFLPLAHVFARMIQCGAVQSGTRLGYTADVANLLPDLAEFRPTFLLSVPRVFEKVYNGAKQRAHADGKGRIFDLAENTAIAYSEALDSGGAGLALRIRHGVFDRLVYSKLRAALGGQCQSAISGGAPLGARLGHFFRGIGVTIYEGYGLTETSAASTVNVAGGLKIGTVGRPLPGVSLRIADDGEVLIAGAHLLRGYWHNPAATAEILDAEGWFSSGDLGELDDEGYLRITGRKKEIIVTAGGKNVAPAVLEDRLRAHPLISQCMVVGDQQPFIGALITVDPEAFPAWAERAGKAGATVADLREDADLRAEIQAAVDEANQAVSGAEAIKKFRILAVDFTQEGGELTPKMSIRRHVVLARYADEVSAIYRR